ncbi:MAG: 2-hydroxychromene-2-carboxylate isomerase [Alphaproteobacteria bacterium]|nr:2-hydroxychromene-2-carboxylate isomerase [Alphaproteobacteria bacterium]
MTLSFDFYFSFRSPYSYLATPQIEALLAQYDAAARMRIVLPIAVRIPGFFQTVNPLWPPYLMRDTLRIAQMNDIPYRWPRPDPIVQDPMTRMVAEDQPYIHRVSRLGAAAERAGAGFAFVRRAAAAVWSGAIDNWHEGDHLAAAARGAGLDPAALDAAIAADPAGHDSEIEENQAAQTAAGHWGVPLFVFEGEPFFGQDRIDHLLWRMKQRGLASRG